MASIFGVWRSLNARITSSRLDFSDVLDELMDVLWVIKWRDGNVEPGVYRQKGNYYRDTIISLVKVRVKSQCDLEVELGEARLRGKTDHVHKVDFAYIRNNAALVAGEVKAIGSPLHRVGGRLYPERNINIDIDKRLKEVKYTPIDLKRLTDPEVSGGWSRWIRETRPFFYSFWLLRLGASNNLGHIIGKLEGLVEYNNGVSVVVYAESPSGYEPVFTGGGSIKSVDELVSEIATIICGVRA